MYPQYKKDQILVQCRPSQRQIAIQRMEFYAFAHFGVNTFTNREWGDGTESEAIFDPTELDANQWVAALKAAGITGLLLTCKHHDGFCLWPSKFTEHSVKNSPFRDGKGDVVREVSDACRKGGIQFGVYLSPWDRNSPLYGQGKPYDDYFCNQLTELCSEYGALFSVWFDGACGEGPNGKKQLYDWDRYYELIRRLQPNAAIAISGPDVRWCGNEAGDTRPSEWSVLPSGFDTPESVAQRSQQSDGSAFREKKIDEMQQDLGSRSFLEGASGYVWRPAETDTSIRPGWFYHPEEDNQVSSLDRLMDIWYRSVGGNSTLLLNIPPDRRGLFHENDVQRLREIGETIRSTFARNLAEDAQFTADRDDGCHLAENLKTDSYNTYFKTHDGENAVNIHIRLKNASAVTLVVIKEHIPASQRIEEYQISVKRSDGTWQEVNRGTTVGYQKIAKFEPVLTQELRISISDSRVCPVLSFIGVY